MVIARVFIVGPLNGLDVRSVCRSVGRSTFFAHRRMNVALKTEFPFIYLIRHTFVRSQASDRMCAHIQRSFFFLSLSLRCSMVSRGEFFIAV